MSTALDITVMALLDHTRAALATTAAGTPDRVCDTAGQLAWDGCDCGVLSVTVDRLYLSRTFPQQAITADPAFTCPPPYLVAGLTVTVLRCAPSPSRTGKPPDCAQLDTAAQTWFADLDGVRRAVACAAAGLRDAGTIEEYALGDQTPVGPEGGCVGLESHLSVGFVNCGCVG